MTAKRRLHPSLLLVLVPVVITALTIYIVGWKWPELAAGMSGKTETWFLRAAPIPALLFGPLGGLFTVLVLPLHRRRPIAMAGLVCFLAVAGFYCLREYGRLAPPVESGFVSWGQALSYLDMMAVIGALAGLIAAAIAAPTSLPNPAR